MNVTDANRDAWNIQSRRGSPWCIPVSTADIQRARAGDWSVILTPNKPVPRTWFGDLAGRKVLCLASGGGQQAPILAAAGAEVVSFDLSEEQLAKDRLVADRDNLPVRTIQGDMANLSALPDGGFDFIFQPSATGFVPDLAPVWSECHRVLQPGGRLLAGFLNPAFFLFDHEQVAATGILAAKYRLPYSDRDTLTPAEQEQRIRAGDGLSFSHSLESQIGGQLRAGFVLLDLYEDDWSDDATPLNRLMPTSLATLAQKRPLGSGTMP
jgi:SAM-dependent methyltransferase